MREYNTNGNTIGYISDETYEIDFDQIVEVNNGNTITIITLAELVEQEETLIY